MSAVVVARKYYGEDMSAFSIPAAEHSTITSWGKENEVKAFENMLDQFPEGLVAVVSDSYDIFNACKNLWGKELKEKVLNRNGTLVIRPDSGEPTEIVPKVLDTLGEAFGYTLNEKGYKELPPQVRIIQGDGINFESGKEILRAVAEAGWSTDMLAFGMGGALLQGLNRDTQKFAFKCSSITVNGEQRDVYKDPVTDHGKRSKAGRLKLVKVMGSHGYAYATEKEGDSGRPNELVMVFQNGILFGDDTLSQIRERAEI
jgi:nicotinamide phosphoribosyltransferase